MILIGRYLSPFTRRVAISMKLLGLPYEHNPLATTTDKEAIRKVNPLARVPALVLDDEEVLIDSAAILDHIDESVGPERALIPAKGTERRQVMRLVALALGVAEKTVSSFYEQHRRPSEKTFKDWVDECNQQIQDGLAEIEAAAGGGWLACGKLTQADVTTVCALEFVRKVLPELAPEGSFPRLTALSARAHALPAFAETRP